MNHEAGTVSLVVTACGRVDLLQQTVESFLHYNTYPISQAVLIDDSGDSSVHERLSPIFDSVFDVLLLNDANLGQIKSIDKAYSYVDSTHIFHCEDDWLFTRPGFIEDSLSVLDDDHRIVTVWLRDRKHFPAGRTHWKKHKTVRGTVYRDINPDYSSNWHGFTFNPGLRRFDDYKRVAPFGHIGCEYEINKLYYQLGYRAAILENAAVSHIGWENSTRERKFAGRRRKPRTWWQKRLGINKWYS